MKGYYLVGESGNIVSNIVSANGYLTIGEVSCILGIYKDEVQKAVKKHIWFYAGGMDVQIKYGTHHEDPEYISAKKHDSKPKEKPKQKCFTFENGKQTLMESKSENSFSLF